MQNKLYLILLAGIFAALCLFNQTASADADPYNALIWNRSNQEAGLGQVDRGEWYEWWYYKVVDPVSREAFYFTYGVINPWDTENTLAGTRSVVQIGDFNTHTIVTGEYPVTDFHAAYNQTAVEIGGNVATDKKLVGHLVQNGHDVSWDLTLTKQWGFEAMGWSMSQENISNIYWYPAQASALVSGTITFDGRQYEFAGAPGYQDRNWGRSFPKWWTWLTSNHFKNSPGTTLAAGGGMPKAFDSAYLFAGICIGLNHLGREYAFRNTDGDQIKYDISWGRWEISAENQHNQKIVISAYAPPEKFMMLPFMSPEGAVFYDYEALMGHMTVKLYKRANFMSDWRQIADLETDEAGIEWGTPEPLSQMNLNQQ